MFRKAKESFLGELRHWPGWWRSLGPIRKVGPALGVLVYWMALMALHGMRGDHLTMGLLILVLSYGGRAGSFLLRFLLPLVLTGIIYDSQRFYSDFIRGPIHVREPYEFDRRFFGITTSQGLLTPNEWWQLHTHPALDFVTGLAYLVFIGVYVITAAYFQMRFKRHGIRMMWSFLWVNLLGYSTYYWYAAAPPWYVARYGLGPARMDTPASQAGCVRFDQLLGTHFFSEMYGRAADVFGAIPSLHVSYPFLAILYAFQLRSLRAFSVFFYLLMCFSAIYLNHHYLLDILWGTLYAALIYLVMEKWIAKSRWRA